MKKKKVQDLGLTFEEASIRPDFFNCYYVLGKYYTATTFHTAPPVLLGQCPICAEFTWNERDDVDFGECSACGFAG